MKKPIAVNVTLTCYPPIARWLRSVDVNATWPEPNVLKLMYVISGEISRLRIPELTSRRQTDGLWQHTCFELFVRANGEAYYEFNFSPSNEWAAYSFQNYRVAAPFDGDMLPPIISVRHESDRWELSATIHLDCLSTRQFGSPLRVGLSAVLEDNDGQLSYWALKHPADKPDFHHPDSFALELALPERSA